MISIKSMTRMVTERGPRYAVTATIRGGEFAAAYALDAEAAEQRFEQYKSEGCRDIKVHVPDVPAFDIDLVAYGRDRTQAQTVLAEKTEILRAAVLRAAELGRAEAEIARSAGVDRMTVRSWLGK